MLLKQALRLSVSWPLRVLSVGPAAAYGAQQHPVRVMSAHAQPSELLTLDGVHPRACAVLKYWFGDGFDSQPWSYSDEERKKLWYGCPPETDEEIRRLFGGDLDTLQARGYQEWTSPQEQLAAIILADQLCRNAYRGTAKMYSLDDLGLSVARDLVGRNDFRRMHAFSKQFAVMPFMHSESMADHELLKNLVEGLVEEAESYGEESMVKNFQHVLVFADAHSAVIKKWSRYPHRNAILGRESTPEEEAGIADGSIPKW